MRNPYLILSLLLFFFIPEAGKTQCTSNISASASTVCAGGNVTLNVNSTGPSNALTTTMVAGNNHRGNMFDITAINTVMITSFDAHPMGNTTIAIFYKAGTFVGFENSPASWTLVGSAAVTAQPMGTPTPVPVAVNVTIPAGQTYAFYITSTNTTVSLNYTNGTAVGNILVSDANINFKEGAGMEYPFTAGTGATYTPRDWNGVIHYVVVGGSTYLWNTSATTQSINPTLSSSTLYSCLVNTTGCPSANPSINISVSIPPVNGGLDQTVCNGTAVTLTGSGAVSYSWDNSVTDGTAFTPSASMAYIVTGTDSIGCTVNDTVTVNVNPLPVVNAGSDQTICSGTPTTLSGSGANSYSWDNSVSDGIAFTPASTLNYIVTGTDINGCMNTDTVMVTVNPLPVVGAGSDMIMCAGTTANLSGTGAVSYTWDNGVMDGITFTPAATSNYIVTGTDANGCMNSDTMNITVNPLPTVNAGSDQTLCGGSQTTLSGSGASTYTWDNGVSDGVQFTPVSSMSYIVTGTDVNGCMNTDTVTVNVNTVNVATSFLNETITASASGASYQWINCSNNSPIAGATNQSYTATANGSYAVIVTVNGCSDTSACQTISSVGIDEISGTPFSVYPNPTDGKLTLSTGNTIADEISIMDAFGKTINTIKPESQLVKINLESYADGLYFVRISTSGNVNMIKVVKK